MLNGPRRTPLALALTFAAIGLGAASSFVVEADNEARLRALPIERRRALAAELARFDLLDRTDRDAILKLDARLAGLPPEERARDLGLLRRYYLWHQGLTEDQKQALADASMPTRVALIRQFREARRQDPGSARRDDPVWTRSPGFNPLTFAEEAFQIRLWPHLPPRQREILEKIPHDLPRMARLDQMARKHGQPAAFRDVLTNGGVLRSQLYEHLHERQPAEAIKLLGQIRRQQDDHFRHAPPPAVELPELNRFEATFPPWIRERIVALPPDAARWRLMILHDLVFVAPIVEPGPRPKPAAGRAAPPAAPAPHPRKDAKPPKSPAPAKDQSRRGPGKPIDHEPPRPG